jgi:hypothetical protein
MAEWQLPRLTVSTWLLLLQTSQPLPNNTRGRKACLYFPLYLGAFICNFFMWCHWELYTLMF